MPTALPSDEEHAAARDAGKYVCQCPGDRTRDPAFLLQCGRCLRRIHPQFDYELEQPCPSP